MLIKDLFSDSIPQKTPLSERVCSLAIGIVETLKGVDGRCLPWLHFVLVNVDCGYITFLLWKTIKWKLVERFTLNTSGFPKLQLHVSI